MRYNRPSCRGERVLRSRHFLIVLALGMPVMAQSPCDPRLPLHSGIQETTAYRLRGDRCEGIYVRSVAGNSVILIASFSEPFSDFQDRSKTIELAWPAQSSEVRIRAYPLRERLYYQMDAVVPPHRGSYSWQRDVLDALHLVKQDIGIVAFSDAGENTTEGVVYLPLRVRSHGVSSKRSSYELILVPNVELTEVYLSLRRVSDGGTYGPYLFSDVPGKRGYYPAERGARLRFERPQLVGLYSLEIGATVRDGGLSSQRMYFYEPGPTP